MKGLVLLFLTTATFGILWGYADKNHRKAVIVFARKNLLPISFAVLAVSIAIFLSTNTTLRLV